MNSRRFRIITWTISIITILIVLFLFWLSREAVYETEDWIAFDFDFKGKEGVISSYGTLLAAILSFIAILFVLLDLLYQRRLKEIEDEVKDESRIQEYRDNMSIIQLFSTELINSTGELNVRSKSFVTKEKSLPSQINLMGFSPNTYPKLILDVDQRRFYEAIKYFQPGEDWRKLYVDLYRIVDFYDKSFVELKNKHQIHLDKKFALLNKLGDKLDNFIDNSSIIRNNIIVEAKKAGKESIDDPFFSAVDFINSKAIEIKSREVSLEDRAKEDFIDPHSMTVWHDELFKKVFDDILGLWNTHGYDSHGLKDIHKQVQSLIREYSRLVQDSIDYANHIENYFESYFSKDSKYIKRLSKIRDDITNSLN